MTPSSRERDYYRPKWRMLTQAAIRACAQPGVAASDLKMLAQSAKAWHLPTPDRADDLACAALIAAAKAYCAQTRVAERQAHAAGLAVYAALVGDVLDASDPVRTAGRPRADIDG